MTEPAQPDPIAERLVFGLFELAGQLAAAASSPETTAKLLDRLGWQADKVPGMSDAVAAVGRAVDQVLSDLLDLVDEEVSGPGSWLHRLADLAPRAKAVGQAVGSLSHLKLTNPPPTLDRLGQELLLLLAEDWLRENLPAVAALASITGCYLPQRLARPQPAVQVSGQTVRKPYQLPEFHLDKLVSLVTGPLDSLRQRYLPAGGLTNPAAVQALAGSLFPVLADALPLLADGLGARYGALPDLDPPLSQAEADLLAQALTVWLLEGAASEPGRVALAVALTGPDPSTDNRPAVLLAPLVPDSVNSGSRGWTVIGEITGALPLTLLGGQAIGATSGEPVGLTLGLRLPGSDSTSAAEISVTIKVDGAGAYELQLKLAGRTVLELDPFGRDGLLSSLLPATTLTMPVELAVTASRTGIQLVGSASLGGATTLTTMPGQTFGPVVIAGGRIDLRGTDGGLSIDAVASIGAQIGPIGATVLDFGWRLGIGTADDGGSLGPLDGTVELKPPSGVQLAVDAPMISGGGLLASVSGGYLGSLQLTVGPVTVGAVGLLITENPDGSPLTDGHGQPTFSLLIMLTASFPPVQLGLGFALTGLGGMLGLNRTFNLDAIRAGVRNGGLSALLFPADPAGHPAQLLAALVTDFPIAVGRFVGGPMAKLTWGDPVIATVELAVLVELPDPVRIVLAGRLLVGLPHADESALVRIHLDALGVLDLGAGSLSLDASIYASRIGAFTLVGDMALRMAWRGQRQFLMSIGGWHPAFQPPPGFPALRRVTLALSGGDDLQLTVAAYFAVTSNTVQFGGRADLRLSGGGAVAEGSVSLDTLITLAPFGLRVDFAASVSISFLGMNLLAITLSGTLSGPSPWHVHGTVSISLLFFSVSISLDLSFGSSAPLTPAAPPVNVLQLLAAEVAKPANWLATLPVASLIRLPDAPPDAFRLHPLAQLAFHQRLAPLGVHLDRLGPAGITGPNKVSVRQASLNGHLVTASPTVLDQFAPVSYLNLTDDQKLAVPSFSTEQAGVSLAEPAPDVDPLGAADVASLTFDLEFIDPDGELPPTGATPTGAASLASIAPTPASSVSSASSASSVRPAVAVRARPSRWSELVGTTRGTS